MPVEHAVLDFFTLEEFTNDTAADAPRHAGGRLPRDGDERGPRRAEGRPHRRPSVDLSSFAVLRSLAADNLGMGGEVEALVDVGARVTNIVVHQGGAPRFVRILLMGGQDLTDAVAERMGVPQRRPRRSSRSRARHDAESVDDRLPRPRARGARSSTRSAARWTTTRPPRVGADLAHRADRRRRAADGLADRLQSATRPPVVVGNPMDGLALGRTGLSPGADRLRPAPRRRPGGPRPRSRS